MGLRLILGSTSKCIFNGRFKNKTGDMAVVVGCMDSETVVNIARNGRVRELTLRENLTLHFVSKPVDQNGTAFRVKRHEGKCLRQLIIPT